MKTDPSNLLSAYLASASDWDSKRSCCVSVVSDVVTVPPCLRVFESDRAFESDCASSFSPQANLNGVAHTGTHEGPDGINWLDWKGPNYSIKATRMMVK